MLGLVTVWGLGALAHHLYGAPPGGSQPPWSQALFVSYNLLFLEHIAPCRLGTAGYRILEELSALGEQVLVIEVRASLGFQVTVSTSSVAAPLFAAAALDPNGVGAHRLGDQALLESTALSPA